MIDEKSSILTIQFIRLYSKILDKNASYSATFKFKDRSRSTLKKQITSKTNHEVDFIGEEIKIIITSSEFKINRLCCISVEMHPQNQLSKIIGEYLFDPLQFQNYSKKKFTLSLNNVKINAQLIMNLSLIDVQKNIRCSDGALDKCQEHSREPLLLRKNNSTRNLIQIEEKQNFFIEKDFESAQSCGINSDQSQKNRQMDQQMAEIKKEGVIFHKKYLNQSFHSDETIIRTLKIPEEPSNRRNSGEYFLNDEESHDKNYQHLEKKNEIILEANQEEKQKRCKEKHYSSASKTFQQIGHDLERLKELEGTTNQLNKLKQSAFEIEENDSIFNTMGLLNKKLQSIHEKEVMLNSKKYIAQNEQTNLKNTSTFNFNEKMQPKHKSMDFMNNSNLSFGSKCQGYQGVSNQKTNSDLFPSFNQDNQLLSKENDKYYDSSNQKERKKTMRIESKVVNIKHKPLLTVKLNSHQRKQSISIGNMHHHLNMHKAQTLVQDQPCYFQVEENQDLEKRQTWPEFYQRMALVKIKQNYKRMNTLELAKNINHSLVIANQELALAYQKIEEKLQVSKNIIADKEEMLTNEFQNLKKQIFMISQKLQEKNKESFERENKIHLLSNQCEIYVKQLNILKQKLKENQIRAQQLRYLLYVDQENIQEKRSVKKSQISQEKQEFSKDRKFSTFTPRQKISPFTNTFSKAITSNTPRRGASISSTERQKQQKKVQEKLESNRSLDLSNIFRLSIDRIDSLKKQSQAEVNKPKFIRNAKNASLKAILDDILGSSLDYGVNYSKSKLKEQLK